MPVPSNDDKELSQAVLLDTPRPMTFDYLLGDLVVLLGGGIVNPYGPTLELIAGIGHWRSGQDMPVVRAMLNPFTQEISQVGVLSIRDRIRPFDTLSAFLPICQIACPTALLLSPLLKFAPQAITPLLSAYLAARPSGDLVLTNVTKFPGDPRTRVRHEAAQAMATITARRDGGPAVWQERRTLTEAEAAALAAMQLRSDFLTAEWNAFVLCWLESIQSSPIKDLTMPYRRVELVVTKVVASTLKTLEDISPKDSGTSIPNTPDRMESLNDE